MIDIAISIDEDSQGITVVETNHGDHLAAPSWPQDSDSRLVSFDPESEECDVVAPRELARDIALALQALETGFLEEKKLPEWYKRLKRCAAGAENEDQNEYHPLNQRP
jgi:hypothetical protein